MKVTKIDTPKPKETKIYWGVLLLSWIPFVGLGLSLNGLVRSVSKVVQSRKKHTSDKRAIKGVVISSIALVVSIAAINLVLNPSPSITLDATKGKIATDDKSYTLVGKVSNSENGTLTINDVSVPIIGEEFSYTVDLEEGDNEFHLVATNENGETKKTITVHRTTQAEFAARAEKERLEAEKKANEAKDKNETRQESSSNSADNASFYINNAYFKGDNKYDVVAFSPAKDTLKIYVNDDNPIKAKSNNEGWVTFKNVSISGRAKLSFAKSVGWSKYEPVNYVKYIIANGDNVRLVDAGTIAALEKAEAEAKAAEHKKYIDNLATNYCANHTAWRKIYVPQSTSKEVWDNPNKDLVTTYPKQSDCVTIMTFFVDVMPSDYIDQIVSKKVAVGMNRAEVLASWGWPNNNSNYSSSLGSSDTWNYNTGTCYYGVCPNQQYVNFYNGKVTSTGNY